MAFNYDGVFMDHPSDIPVIDLTCSPTNDYFPTPRTRKRLLTNAGLSELEVINVNESSSENKGSKLANNIEGISNKSAEQSAPMVRCPICLESVLKRIPTTTTCGHIFCFKCISLALESNKKCPLCKRLKPNLIKLYGLESR